MTDGQRRGRLLDPAHTPAAGERIEDVVRVGNVVVEQILSGRVQGPLDYLQEHDEWVVVLAGAATLEVGGTPVDLGAGDWVLLPAGVPHRLLRVERGTNWLGVHVHPAPPPPDPPPPAPPREASS
jgi:mannose-6-phosphate isomerase-like protein (cupin superfamily)